MRRKCHFLQRFHALRDDPQLEAPGHADHRGHNGRIVAAADLTDEQLIDLEGIDWKLEQIAQAGVARAEVIDRHLYPSFPHGLEGGRRELGTLHQDAFGQLELERSWIEAGLGEYGEQIFQKALLLKLYR